MDVDAIPLGVDFRAYIERAMNAMDALVAIIGPDWCGRQSSGQSRLLDPDDPVRLELEMAASKSLEIVPVLVEGATMPGKELFPESLQQVAFLNAATVSSGVDFDHHVARLTSFLEGNRDALTIASPARHTPVVGILPKQLTALIGRESEVAVINALVEGHPLVTIAGPGGIGKTRIALAVATSLRSAKVDGAWFIDLSALGSADLVAAEIATTLGIVELAGRSVLENLITNLLRRDLLLVLDNCEHVIDEAAAVVDAILRRCEDVTILTTSREPLGITGEHVYSLAPLAMPPVGTQLAAERALDYAAIALFCERAAAANPQFSLRAADAETIADICRRLDGIPLAIALAAARTNVLTVRQIGDRLNARFEVLTGGSRTAAQRQQTMRAAIDWSFDLLTTSERNLFVRLAIFADGWSIEAAEAVCASSETERTAIVERLSSLARKSLVVVDFERDRARYRMLESTKAYALERGADFRSELEERFLSWVDRFTATFATDVWSGTEHSSLAEIRGEIANIRLALAYGLTREESIPIAAGVIYRLARSMFWYDAGLESEGRRWVKAALAAIAPQDRGLAGKLWGALAGIAVGREAVEAASKAVEMLQRAGDESDRARALTALALGLFQLGRSAEADEASRAALEIYETHALTEHRGYADALLVRADILRENGMLEAARDAFTSALEIFVEHGAERGAASARGNLAELEFFCGDARRALQLVNEATQTFRAIGATSREATALVNAATYHIELGQIEESKQVSLDALKIAHANGDAPIVAVALQNIAAVRAYRRDHVGSARLIGYVDAWYEAEGYDRQWSEKRVEELVNAQLSDGFSADEIAQERISGRLLTQEEAIGEALAEESASSASARISNHRSSG